MSRYTERQSDCRPQLGTLLAMLQRHDPFETLAWSCSSRSSPWLPFARLAPPGARTAPRETLRFAVAADLAERYSLSGLGTVEAVVVAVVAGTAAAGSTPNAHLPMDLCWEDSGRLDDPLDSSLGSTC